MNPLFAYGSLLALQAKVMWGIWRFKDLRAGDTAYYFVQASRWAEDLRPSPVGSSLYLFDASAIDACYKFADRAEGEIRRLCGSTRGRMTPAGAQAR